MLRPRRTARGRRGRGWPDEKGCTQLDQPVQPRYRRYRRRVVGGADGTAPLSSQHAEPARPPLVQRDGDGDADRAQRCRLRRQGIGGDGARPAVAAGPDQRDEALLQRRADEGYQLRTVHRSRRQATARSQSGCDGPFPSADAACLLRRQQVRHLPGPAWRRLPDPGAPIMSYEPKRFDFSIPIRVNLSSDTQTKPSRAMKEAMMEAEVGDEQMGSDPTIWELCDRSAALLGKEAAMFLPSGTMCNQVAIATHCRPGEEILAHESSHILSSEGGGAAAIAGALILGLKGERGQFTAAA